jgi:hypothetical protein
MVAPQARAKGSAFAELSAGLALTQPLTEDVALFGNLTGTGRGVATHEEFRTGVGGGEIGIARRFDGLGTFLVAAVGQTFGIQEDFYAIFTAPPGSGGTASRMSGTPASP